MVSAEAWVEKKMLLAKTLASQAVFRVNHPSPLIPLPVEGRGKRLGAALGAIGRLVFIFAMADAAVVLMFEGLREKRGAVATAGGIGLAGLGEFFRLVQ